MPWGPKLILGINEIDEQHKELVSIINQRHKSMKQKKGLQKSGEVLTSLAEYTTFHFAHEEDLFTKFGYP